MRSAPEGEKAKAFGAYYTDGVVAAFLVRWAVRSPSDRLIDPSFGGGVFLEAGLERLRELGGRAGGQVFGVELDPDVHATVGKELARTHGIDRERLVRADFFDLAPAELPSFDAVVGNPPFIRHQSLPGAAREKARARAAAQGVELSRLSSSWAPFLVHGVACLAPGGRLAMVVPAELGHAAYARPVLAFLARSFARTTLLTFRRPLFPALSQDVLLLLAEGKGEPFRAFDGRDLEGLDQLEGLERPIPGRRGLDHRALATGRDRLVTSFVDARAEGLYRELAAAPRTVRLGELADVGIGYVSGGNGFFHLSPEAAAAWGLPADVLVRTAYRGRALRGLRFTERDWEEAARSGSAGYLLRIGKGRRPDERVRAYLEHGEAAGVHRAYKCRARSPWYRVLNVRTPDAFLTYMSGLRPSLVANEARASAPNTLHTVRLREGAGLAGDGLAALWRSSLTGLSVEIEGRALGGGMLKLEPGEAKRVLLPAPDGDLGGVALEVDALLRAGRDEEARRHVDRAILRERLNLSEGECELLRAAGEELRIRRYHRGRAARGVPVP